MRGHMGLDGDADRAVTRHDRCSLGMDTRSASRRYQGGRRRTRATTTRSTRSWQRRCGCVTRSPGGRSQTLDATAYEAACGYYGACANAVANYAQTVINRARLWESESALSPAAPEVSPLSATPGTRLAELIEVANQIAAMRIPYCWGGGHAAVPGPSPGYRLSSTAIPSPTASSLHDPEPGLDCSGAVRWLLVSVGYRDPGGSNSGEMGGLAAPGPGRYVNVYYNPEHVFLTVEGHAWGTSDSNYRGGRPGWIAAPYSTAGYAVAHPPGL